jgi:peptide/nickel transport system substrate-binding protein
MINMNKIRSLALALSIGTAGLVLAGCPSAPPPVDGGTTTPTTTVTPGTTEPGTADPNSYQAKFGLPEEPKSEPGKYGGAINTATISDPKTFNLWVSGETSSSDVLGPIYEALNQRNAYTLKFEDRLADLPTISADGLTYTYKLKDGVTWSDGKPLTADDVTFTLDVILDPKTDTIIRESMLFNIKQPDGTVKQEPFKYRKVDDRTVEFKLPEPFAPAESVFSFPIAPKHKLEAAFKAGKINATWGVNTKPTELVGSGPVLIKEYVPGQRVVFTRNPKYWLKAEDAKQLPYLDQWSYLIVPDVNATTLKFRGKETDVLGIQATDYPDIKKGETEGNYEVIDRGPAWGFNYLSFNMNPTAKMNADLRELFSDVRFRRAVSHAVNRSRIAEDVFQGLAEPSYSPVPVSDKNFYNPNVPKYEYDLDKAKAALAEIGLKDGNGNGILEFKGKDITFNILTNTENEQRKAMATIVADDLKKVGLDAKFTPLNFNDLVRRLSAQPYEWEACILGFTGGPEPHDGLNIWRSSGPSHQWHPKQKKPATEWEAEIDKIFQEGARELDPVKRKALYDRWQVIVAEQQPFCFLVTPTQFTAVRKIFGNVKPSSQRQSILWNLEELYSLSATRLTP